ncbi:secreted and transmembrane protein 1A-like isoform X2 [Peromyscus leucopus]|uniref:secreted and transmembrane protein 1A-like isoform X2 n=1 Tax=Peromyscus leucopus TaxID=10041 RepID=UPI0010A10FAA|nr:secreted and transmembrane protein 1A-like isoform X2 [Peromyscus leucopus]
MKTRPSVSIVHTPRMFSILLLAVSLNAQNESWDSPICTEDMLSVPRGSRTVMTCNISNSFTDVSIWLIANGKEMAIFMKKPQGNFHWGGWEFHVQGGQAQLVIKDTQDIHTGLYLWQLHGRQKVFKNITLDVSEPSNKDEATDTRLSTSPPDPVKSPQQEARPKTLVGVVVTVILILGLAGISTLICYRHHRS